MCVRARVYVCVGARVRMCGPHFKGEGAEAREGAVTCLRSHCESGRSRTSDSGPN